MNCKKPLRGKKGNRYVCGCTKEVVGRQKRDGVGGSRKRLQNIGGPLSGGNDPNIKEVIRF